ncbi:hypothetical protein LEP1GSC058_3426 [Leptospira fainei serovar Hurstbridge str. BUT 6]|uniref:Uncharacterized protein n=1 Tax=Leptospira fainei serovar Hurstbridge str. BUT 6 TaxID=1193011 RepID=S3W127_9LEPT|nr:hypothetical protein LEP1GSC058_3426 [Leptospira fainei serovar Hurstbridge str. BUT 6]
MKDISQLLRIGFLSFGVVFLINPLSAQEIEEKTKIDLQGNYRVRGFNLGRDIYSSRQTPVTPFDKQAFQNQYQQNVNNQIQNEINARSRGLPTTLSPSREDMTYYDTRMTLNMNFATSKYFEALAGVQIGDMIFGGKGVGQSSNIGPGQGGEATYSTAVNIQTNFLYLNFKLPEKSFTTRVGLQLFTSAQGRVIYIPGTGVTMTKDIRNWNMTLEGGWLIAKQNNLTDLDKNSFADKNYQGNNIYFYKVKTSFFNNARHELYSYYMDDTLRDIQDTNGVYGLVSRQSQSGQLFWHGLFNEFNFSDFTLVVHGIYNHGTLHSLNPYRDTSGNEVYRKYDRYAIKGAFFDTQVSYRYNESLTLNFIALGSTGRPGYEKDGTRSNLHGSGYQTLFPGYSVSNIAIDFTGGYALFPGGNVSGLYEYGLFSDIVVAGPIVLTLGYYRLYGTKSPLMDNNRFYNSDNFYQTSAYFGQEYNLNLRWNAFRDMQILLRSGYFISGNGFKAYMDTTGGTFLRELFVTAEHRF